MFEAAIEYFQRFQTSLVGLIGFAGVMITIAMNGRLARQQHERQLTHERNALRTALCAELEAIRRIYLARSEIERDTKPRQSMLIPEYVVNHMYQRLLDRIGLLTTGEIETVMKAYLLVSELPARLRLLAGPTGDAGDYPGYIRIPSEHVQNAAKMHANFLPDVAAAVETLKGKLQASEK